MGEGSMIGCLAREGISSRATRQAHCDDTEQCCDCGEFGFGGLWWERASVTDGACDGESVGISNDARDVA
jgi:hypothetical protein